MPFPHESFSKQFKKDLSKCLYRARSRRDTGEVWCLVHFDQYIDSLETLHSHEGMEGKIYKEELARRAAANPGVVNYAANATAARYQTNLIMPRLPAAAQAYMPMHAEEELIKNFDRIYDDWVETHPVPRNVCIYLNFSPCLTSPGKVIDGMAYPQGCLFKLIHLARRYKPIMCQFTVYSDADFNQPDVPTYQATYSANKKQGFISFRSIPSELKAQWPSRV